MCDLVCGSVYISVCVLTVWCAVVVVQHSIRVSFCARSSSVTLDGLLVGKEGRLQTLISTSVNSLFLTSILTSISPAAPQGAWTVCLAGSGMRPSSLHVIDQPQRGKNWRCPAADIAHICSPASKACWTQPFCFALCCYGQYRCCTARCEPFGLKVPQKMVPGGQPRQHLLE